MLPWKSDCLIEQGYRSLLDLSSSDLHASWPIGRESWPNCNMPPADGECSLITTSGTAGFLVEHGMMVTFTFDKRQTCKKRIGLQDMCKPEHAMPNLPDIQGISCVIERPRNHDDFYTSTLESLQPLVWFWIRFKTARKRNVQSETNPRDHWTKVAASESPAKFACFHKQIS